MDAPQFVAVDEDSWVQVSHIVALIGGSDYTNVFLSTGDTFTAPVPAKDFLARMVAVS